MMVDSPDVLVTKIRTFVFLGDRETAEKICEKAIEYYPHHKDSFKDALNG